MQKKHDKDVYTRHPSFSMQKTARENSLYSKKETILKISKNGHQAMAISFAKSSLWFKN